MAGFLVNGQEVSKVGVDYANFASYEVQDIHIPVMGRISQTEELCRQLGVRMFIDLGFGWGPDKDDDDHIRYMLEEFHFKRGLISEVLDAYCKQSRFKWRFWKDAYCIWLEPLDDKVCIAEKALSKVTMNWSALKPTTDTHVPFLLSQPLTGEEKLNACFSDKKFAISSGVANLGGGADSDVFLVLEVEHLPKTALDVVKNYLQSRELAFVIYDHNMDQFTIDDKRLNMISFGIYGMAASRLSDKNLLESYVQSSHKDVGSFVGEQPEIYRRVCSNKRAWIDIFCKSEAIKTMTSTDLSFLLNMQWSDELKFEIFTEVFNCADGSGKLAILEAHAIPYPPDCGEKDIKFWLKVTEDKNEKVSTFAKNVMKEWELSKKFREKEEKAK